TENQELKKLIQQFHVNTQLHYSGKFEITSSQNITWNLYYQFGQLVWVTGGTHPNRRWVRNISKICPNLNWQKIPFDEPIMSADHWDYLLLLKLYQENLIKSEQINQFVINSFRETFFDIYQHIHNSTFSFARNEETVLELKVISASVRKLLKQSTEEWNNWINSGLANISPHLSPLLVHPENLRHETSSLLFHNSRKFMNGKNTLYDLSIKLQQDVLTIARSLSPYILKGIVKLQEVPDIFLIENQASPKNYTPKVTNNSKTPLIACIDDSPHFCKLMDKIITSYGMNCLSINDYIHALPTLMESKPDLIFLDLVMPIVNGYELCAQMRCSSVFADTPIIILTASERVFDQARAKAFGATDFLNKYITRDTLLQAINKHLQLEVSDNLQPLVS
ncbi:MAG: response regulator, partial [Sphaerospermopsis sp. SIO1G2]|nr:response regulator [Sphaerospermopsis sp. SIO1G2]